MLNDLEKFNYTTVPGLHSNGQAGTGTTNLIKVYYLGIKPTFGTSE